MPKKEQELDEFLDRVFGPEKEKSVPKSEEAFYKTDREFIDDNASTDSTFSKMQEIALERLHPPKAIVSETSESKSSRIERELDPIASLPDSTLAIVSWNEAKEWLLTNSSMDRVLMEFVKKIVPGFENVDPRKGMSRAQQTVKTAQKKIKEKFDIVEYMKKEKKSAYAGVMNEFKEKVKRIREGKE